MIDIKLQEDKRHKNYLKIKEIEIMGGQFKKNSLIELRDALDEAINQGFTDYELTINRGYYDCIDDVIIEPR